jgi:8-oxo-dGTP pyrophosphatase MutT (NUDIX family)
VFRVTRSLARSPRTGALHPFHTIDADAWVNVVALTPRDEVVMVRQWRHGSREVTLEIPGGIVDPGEAPAQAAARELLEETGFGGGVAQPLGSANPNPALFGNRVHTFLIRGVARQAEIQNGSTEETSVVLVPRGEIPALLRREVIDHALVVAALYRFHLSEVG